MHALLKNIQRSNFSIFKLSELNQNAQNASDTFTHFQEIRRQIDLHREYMNNSIITNNKLTISLKKWLIKRKWSRFLKKSRSRFLIIALNKKLCFKLVDFKFDYTLTCILINSFLKTEMYVFLMQVCSSDFLRSHFFIFNSNSKGFFSNSKGE